MYKLVNFIILFVSLEIRSIILERCCCILFYSYLPFYILNGLQIKSFEENEPMHLSQFDLQMHLEIVFCNE